MSVDEAFLAAHRSFQDERLGITERFVELQVGPAPSIGVITEPTTGHPGPAFVLCHSFGNEQVDLGPTDARIARAVAAAGFPVARFHCQGYGDAMDLRTPAAPSTHLRDTLDAIRELRDRLGLSVVGAIGARFGGTVAAMAAERARLSHVVLAAPIVDGSLFVTNLLRFQRMGEMAVGAQGTLDELRSRVLQEGSVNVQGWVLHRAVYEELLGLNLLASVSALPARVLLLQVSPTPRPAADLTRLAERLEAVGASVDREVVADRAAPQFGYEHFESLSPTRIGDTLQGIDAALGSAIASWLRRELADGGGRGGRGS